MHFDTIKRSVPVAEFSAVCIFLVLPPLLYTPPVTIPEKPYLISGILFMLLKVFAAAAYEEILYRLYVPERLGMLLERYSVVPAAKKQLLAECFAVLCFALAHRYLGTGSVIFAAAAGALFRLLYCIIRRRFSPITAFCAVWLLHGCWNTAVYYYLWNV